MFLNDAICLAHLSSNRLQHILNYLSFGDVKNLEHYCVRYQRRIKLEAAVSWRSKLQSILGRCHDYGLKRSSPISGNWRAFLEYIRQYYPQNLITGYRPSDMATEDYGRRCVCVCVQYGANPPKLAYGNRSMGTNLLR